MRDLTRRYYVNAHGEHVYASEGEAAKAGYVRTAIREGSHSHDDFRQLCAPYSPRRLYVLGPGRGNDDLYLVPALAAVREAMRLRTGESEHLAVLGTAVRMVVEGHGPGILALADFNPDEVGYPAVMALLRANVRP